MIEDYNNEIDIVIKDEEVNDYVDTLIDYDLVSNELDTILIDDYTDDQKTIKDRDEIEGYIGVLSAED